MENLRVVNPMDPQDAKLDFGVLNAICSRAFYLALKMIQAANARPKPDKAEPKVGGHATACASSQHILSAIHLVMRNPEDYMAFKPHISPLDHALNFLLHNFRDSEGQLFDLEKRQRAMHHLRHYSPEGHPVFQSYHAESDPDSFRYFPSGSVGIPPVQALYTELGYRLAKDHGFELNEDPYFWCVMGDSEFREGSLQEAIPDAGERQLNHQVWVVDYNRQNLDGTRVTNEKALGGSDADRIVGTARANGWNAIKLKHGKLREALFQKPGGEEFKRVLDEVVSDFEFQALLEANRPELTHEALSKKSPALGEWLKWHKPEEIHEAFLNLGGHDLRSLVETFRAAKQSDKPTLVVAYTIKGYGLQCQARSGNHSTLPDDEELQAMAQTLRVSDEAPFEDFAQGSPEETYLSERRNFLLDGIRKIFEDVQMRRHQWIQEAKSHAWPTDFDVTSLKLNPMAHTQWMWGQIAAKLDRLARGEKNPISMGALPSLGGRAGWEAIAPFFLTMAPDVGTSTNTSPNMNGKLYGEVGQDDFQSLYNTKDKKAPDIIPHLSERSGHLRFEIAEGNCMSAAGSFGKFAQYVGIPFYPAMTIYDFFIKRCHDQFYYNLYWKSCFATLGTPSGVTLAPEGAQHSWKSDFQIPNCITWEPCFARELDWILADTLRRHFTGENEGRESALIRCVTKGLPQKELLGRLKQQQRFANQADDAILEAIRQDVLKGGYALIDHQGQPDYTPGDNVVHLFAMGALGIEAVKASDALREQGIFANVFIVTSPDLLLGNFAYQDGYQHLAQGLGVNGDLYLNRRDLGSEADWFAAQGSRIPIVSTHDGEPGLLDNIGSIVGVKHQTLAIRKTSKSGTTPAIFRLHGIDSQGIVEAALKVLEQTANESFRLHSSLGSPVPN